MAGQLVQRGERSWYVRVFLGRDADGQRKFHNKTIHGTKKDAQRYLNAVLRELDLGAFVEPGSQTLNGYLDHWLEAAAKPRLRDRTYDDYVSWMQRYVREPLGQRKLSELRALDIQKLYSEMQERGLSARTVRYTHAILSSALKQAVRWGMLARNPAELVQLPKPQRQEMRALSPAETKRFLEVLAPTRHATLFQFAVTTGMRPEESLGLQWKDVDFKAGTAIVQRVMVYRQKGGGWQFTEPKTSRSRRTVPLPASIVRALHDHKRQQNEHRLLLGPEWHNHDLVFCTELGTPLNLQNLTQRHFKPALRQAGLNESVRLYDLRHTCATLLLQAGENPKVVSERLGHASITLTLDVYSHVLPDMQKAAAEKLERMLYG